MPVLNARDWPPFSSSVRKDILGLPQGKNKKNSSIEATLAQITGYPVALFLLLLLA